MPLLPPVAPTWVCAHHTLGTGGCRRKAPSGGARRTSPEVSRGADGRALARPDGTITSRMARKWHGVRDPNVLDDTAMQRGPVSVLRAGSPSSVATSIRCSRAGAEVHHCNCDWHTPDRAVPYLRARTPRLLTPDAGDLCQFARCDASESTFFCLASTDWAIERPDGVPRSGQVRKNLTAASRYTATDRSNSPVGAGRRRPLPWSKSYAAAEQRASAVGCVSAPWTD